MALTRVILASGRSVELSEIRLSATYGGMLEGYPFRGLNDRKIDSLVRHTRRLFPATPVHLVPPRRDHPDQSVGPFGPVETLPAVTCVGTFGSSAIDPEHDPVLYRSALTVVWFQDTPHVPAEEAADPGLCAIPWEEVAEDYEL